MARHSISSCRRQPEGRGNVPDRAVEDKKNCNGRKGFDIENVDEELPLRPY